MGILLRNRNLIQGHKKIIIIDLYSRYLENNQIMDSTRIINKKIPGVVPPIGKLEDEAKKFNNEIIKKPTSELKDLLNRQNAILNNPKLISNLADKGTKVRLRQQMLQV